MARSRHSPTQASFPTPFTGQDVEDAFKAAIDGLWESIGLWAVQTGGPNDITLTIDPALDSPGAVAGMEFKVVATSTNTLTMTADLNTVGSNVNYPIVDRFNQPVKPGAWLTGGLYRLIFDGASLRIVDGIRKIGFSATKNGTDQTSITSATQTKLTFTTEVFDHGGFYDAASSRWVPPAGKVMLLGAALFSAAVVDQNDYRCSIYKNGTRFKTGTIRSSGTGALAPSVVAIDNANGTDYYELYGYGAGTGAKTVSGAAEDTYFQGSAISSAAEA